MKKFASSEIFFSKKIRELRDYNNLSLEKAGNLIGIPMVELYKYENLELCPNLSIMNKIARAYNVPLKSLCSEAQEDSEIVAYKLMIRAYLDRKGCNVMILFETIIDKKERDLWGDISAYFTIKNNEVVIEVAKNEDSLPYQTIYWKEYMKYRLIILDHKRKTSYKDLFGNYEPYSENFNNILTKYQIEIKEDEKIFLYCMSLEESLMLTKKNLEYLKTYLL